MKKFAVVLAMLSLSVAAAPAMSQTKSASAVAAEAVVKKLLDSAAPGHEVDYSIMTPEVAAQVRSGPEVSAMVRSWGPAKSVEYLGNPPGAELFKVTYEASAIDFLVVLNGEGKISAMYFHPHVEMAEPAAAVAAH